MATLTDTDSTIKATAASRYFYGPAALEQCECQYLGLVAEWRNCAAKSGMSQGVLKKMSAWHI